MRLTFQIKAFVLSQRRSNPTLHIDVIDAQYFVMMI